MQQLGRALLQYLIEQILCHKTLFFSLVSTTTYAFSLAMNNTSSFYCLTTVHGHPEHSLHFTLLLPLLNHTIHPANQHTDSTCLIMQQPSTVNSQERVDIAPVLKMIL